MAVDNIHQSKGTIWALQRDKKNAIFAILYRLSLGNLLWEDKKDAVFAILGRLSLEKWLKR
jgi:hypothetical protein